MAAFTSKATGNWSASGQTTWNESGVPGAGDTATIGAGHTVTVTANTTIDVVNCAHSGSVPGTVGLLEIVGCKLTVTTSMGIGPVYYDDHPTGAQLYLTITSTSGNQAGIEFDGGVGVQPVMTLGVLSKVTVTGLAGYHAYIRTKLGTLGDPAYITRSGSPGVGGYWDAQYCDFSRLGDASHPAIGGLVLSSTYPGGICRFRHCDIDACAQLPVCGVADGGADMIFQHCRWTNPVHSDAFTLSWAVSTGGTREFTDCAVREGLAHFTGMSDLVLARCILGESFINSSDGFGTAGQWDTFEDTVIAWRDAGFVELSGGMADVYTIERGTGTNLSDNWHVYFGQDTRIGTSIAFDGLIFDAQDVDNSTDIGELIGFGGVTGSHSRTVTIKDCITLPSMTNMDGESFKAACGDLLGEVGGTTTWQFVVEHNTAYICDPGGTAGMLTVGDVGAHGTDDVTSCRANIAWGPASGGGYLVRNGDMASNSAPDDWISANRCDYNGRLNLGAGSAGNPSGIVYVASTPAGVHDVTTDPNFIVPTRNMATWAVTIGSGGSTNAEKVDDALDYLCASTATIAARVTDLFAYVRAGFRPQNASYANATYPGDPATLDAAGNPNNGTIGAMAVEEQGGGGDVSPSPRSSLILWV